MSEILSTGDPAIYCQYEAHPEARVSSKWDFVVSLEEDWFTSSSWPDEGKVQNLPFCKIRFLQCFRSWTSGF